MKKKVPNSDNVKSYRGKASMVYESGLVYDFIWIKHDNRWRIVYFSAKKIPREWKHQTSGNSFLRPFGPLASKFRSMKSTDLIIELI